MLSRKTNIKRLLGFGLASALLVSSLAQNSTYAEGPSSYFDANAAACVVENYNSTTGSSVTSIESVDFSKVTTLDCANRNITRLRGITLFPNLTELNLSGNTSLAVDQMDFSQNTKLTSLYLYNAGNYYSLNLSHNPELSYLSLRPVSGHTPTVTFSSGISKLAEDKYGFDLSQFKWYDGRAYYLGNGDEYPYELDETTNQLIFTDRNKIPYSAPFTTSYGGAFYVSSRSGYLNYAIYFNGDEEVATHNPIYLNNNCEESEDGYYHCNNAIFAGDTFDSEAIVRDTLAKIFNLDSYELSKVEIVPPTANVDLEIDTETVKKGTALPDANFTLRFYFDQPSTPATPNTGLFTNEDGSLKVANLLLSLASLSVAAFLLIFLSRRLITRTTARRF